MSINDEWCTMSNKKVKAVILVNINDFVIEKNGEVRLKRKYGKFKRQTIRIK